MHEESVMLIVNQMGGGGRLQTGSQGLGEEHVGRHWW